MIEKTEHKWFNVFVKCTGYYLRIHMITFLLGTFISAIGFFGMDYLEFSQKHSAFRYEKYQETIQSKKGFDYKLAQLNDVVFEKQDVSLITNDINYALFAQEHIHQIKAVSGLFPNTEEMELKYISSISNLNKYYTADIPERGTDDWFNFYGNFRDNYDQYILAENEYFDALSSEIGDYKKHISSS